MRAADDPVANPVVVAYLEVLVGALPTGRRTHAAIRAELSDGLACAIDDRVERGSIPRT